MTIIKKFWTPACDILCHQVNRCVNVSQYALYQVSIAQWFYRWRTNLIDFWTFFSLTAYSIDGGQTWSIFGPISPWFLLDGGNPDRKREDSHICSWLSPKFVSFIPSRYILNINTASKIINIRTFFPYYICISPTCQKEKCPRAEICQRQANKGWYMKKIWIVRFNTCLVITCLVKTY